MSYTLEAILSVSGAEQFQAAFRNAEKSVEQFSKAGKSISDIGKNMTRKVTLPIVGAGAAILKIGSDFEASMSKVQALSGATGDDLQALENVARELGATTRYSASEAADALGFMALAGWDTNQMVSALPSVLNLATAGQLELAQASDVVTDMMSMFGIEAKDASKVSDVFARAQANSNTNVEQLSEALRNAGPSANAMGASIEETSAVLGIFADMGIKGGRAGTALRAMYRDLQGSAEDGAIAIGKTSVAVYDADGNMRSMADVMADVEKATAGMTDEQRANALSSVFQAQSLEGVNLLLTAGSDELRGLTEELYNATGSGQEMATIMDDNLQGAMLGMKSALEEVALSFYELAGGPFTNLIGKITELIRWFGQLDESTLQWIMVAAGIAAAIGPILMILGGLMGSITKVIGGIKLMISVIGLLFSPIGLIVAAIAGFVAILVGLYVSNEEARDKINAAWSKIWSTITTLSGQIINVVKEFINGVKRFFQGLVSGDNSIVDSGRRAFQMVMDIIKPIMSNISDLIRDILNRIRQFWDANGEQIISAVKNLASIVVGIFEFFMPLIQFIVNTVWDKISGIISGAIDFILGVIKLFASIFTGDWSGMWEGIKQLVKGGLEFAWNLFQLILIGKMLGGIKTFASNALSNFKGLLAKIPRLFTTGFNNALKAVTGFFGKFRNAGSNIVGNIAKGITGAIGKVTSAIGGVVQKVRDFLPFSPPKDKSSPLADIHKNGIGEQIAGGIYNGQREIEKAMGSVLSVPDIDAYGSTTVTHEMSQSSQPTVLTLNLGNRSYRAFVDDISSTQDHEIMFEETYKGGL